MNYWLLKSEPSTYSIDDLKRDGTTMWEGVRNFRARNNLRAMKNGDLCLFYHSGDKQIVGLAKVVKQAYPDPTAKEGDWSVLDIAFVKKFSEPISLDQVKKDPALKTMELVKYGRLSVQSVTPKEFGMLVK